MCEPPLLASLPRPARAARRCSWQSWRGPCGKRLLLVLLAVGTLRSGFPVSAQSVNSDKARWSVGQATQTGEFERDEIRESSGLASSHRDPSIFWTHNDSGSDNELYAFDLRGRHLGTSHLKGARNDDWESLDSFQLRGTPYLLVGDVGDNALRRPTVSLYLAEEPADTQDDCQLSAELRFRFAPGPVDCEAMALDTERQEVLLLEKQIRSFTSRVFALPWPALIDTDDKTKVSRQVYVAQQIGELRHIAITGADLSEDNRDLIVNTYGNLFLYSREKDESWQSALTRPPLRIAGPPRRQGEAVCFDHDTLDILVSSEGKAAPLWKIPLTRLTP